MAGAIPKKISVLNPDEVYKPPPTPDLDAYIHKKYNKHRKGLAAVSCSQDDSASNDLDAKPAVWSLSPPPTRRYEPQPVQDPEHGTNAFRPPAQIRFRINLEQDIDRLRINHEIPSKMKLEPDLRSESIPQAWPPAWQLQTHFQLPSSAASFMFPRPQMYPFIHPIGLHSFVPHHAAVHPLERAQPPPLSHAFHIPAETTLTPVEEPLVPTPAPREEHQASYLHSPAPSDDNSSRSSSYGGGDASSGAGSSVRGVAGGRIRRSRKSREIIPEWVKVESIDEFNRLCEINCSTEEQAKDMKELRRKIKNRDAAQRSRQKRIKDTDDLKTTNGILSEKFKCAQDVLNVHRQYNVDQRRTIETVEAAIAFYKDALVHAGKIGKENILH